MIVGIAGSFGAGKGTVVEYLLAHKGFKHYSASGFITEEIERRGLPVNRDSMAFVANDLRKRFGPSHIIDTLYARAQAIGGDAVIESLRAVAEVERIKAIGGVVIGVDAPPALRFKRSMARGSIKDGVSYEKWQEQEAFESTQGDPTKQNIFGALQLADYVVHNEGTLEALYAQVEDFLVRFK